MRSYYEKEIHSSISIQDYPVRYQTTGLKVKIELPDDDDFGRKVFKGWNQKIADYFSMENPSADYIYDFGDSWEHKIQLEKIPPREKNVNYPV
ncbi:plasmid priA4b ORF-3 family protein [groundwater metagenome]